MCDKYCKFGNFREHFISANSVKRHICHVEKSRLGCDLPASVTQYKQYAYEHATSNIINIEIFYLTIYIALECTMSSSPLSQ